MIKTLKINNKILVAIIIFLLLTIALIVFYSIYTKNKIITKEATITHIGKGYIIAEDELKEEYSIPTNCEYNIGDKVSFTMKNIKKNSSPKEGTLVKLDTISKMVEFQISDNITNNIDNQEIDAKNEEIIPEPKEEITTSVKEDKDLTVVSYFENLNNNLNNYNKNETTDKTIKEHFVTIVDFLFYNGTINEKSFKDLSYSAKLKVLKLAFSIDQKIEKYFPEYKEEITTTSNKIYTNVKSQALKLYLDIITKICKENNNLCESAKEGLTELKKNLGLSWDLIVDLAKEGTNNLKEWYEVWKTA